MEPPPHPAAAAPPPHPALAPPPTQPGHETILTLALALPTAALPCALVSPRPYARTRPIRAKGGASCSRVQCSATGDTPPCTECSKRFPSWKALFGHMRCHPERQWRGIRPPPQLPHSRHGAAAVAAGQFTVQEREVAASLLMLSAGRPGPGGAGKDKKSVVNAASPSATESSGTSASASASAPANFDDHKCSVCDRGFASGQALGGHKRCHWDRACAEVPVIATAGSSGSAMSEAAAPAVLDLNLPPPVPKSDDQGSSLNEMLDLKLGY